MRISAFCAAVLTYMVIGHTPPAAAQVDQQLAEGSSGILGAPRSRAFSGTVRPPLAALRQARPYPWTEANKKRI